MTTITKEWLQQTIAEFENTRDDIPFGLSDDDAKVLIVLKRALASLEAEPAGYHVIKECGKVGCSVATLEEAEKTRDFWNKKWTIRPYFYTAQLAPVVPEEIEPDSNNTYDYVDGWNACRAAMLQGAEPVSQTYELNELSGNSPVTPDGWISCSERMPDKGQRVLVCVDFDSSTVTPLVKEAEYTSSTFRIGPNTINTTGKPSVTHWMPVPTAPEPETMNG